MALGDADLASGIFFGDFGATVVFGSQPAAKGNLDAPGKDAMFDRTSVSDTEYRLEVSYVAFNPMPDVKSRLIVDGVAFVVSSSTPLDDGKVVELKMRKL